MGGTGAEPPLVTPPAPPLWSGGIYWWYFSFLILGLESRGFLERGGRVGGTEEARQDWGGEVDSWAVW